jgi:hypothetical protein
MRHVGRVLGQDARRVGDRDAACSAACDVDIVDAVAEIRHQPEVRPGLRQD